MNARNIVLLLLFFIYFNFSYSQSKIYNSNGAFSSNIAGFIENGKIYGSINTIQLAEALKAAGHDIDRKSLKIKDEPIREVGSYEAEANLYKGVKQTIKFSVVAE